MVALDGLSAGISNFVSDQFNKLAPNVLFVSSAQGSQNAASGFGLGGNGPPPAPKITLNSAVVSKLKSLPYVSDVVPTYQAQITLVSSGKSLNSGVFSIDPSKLYVIAPTLQFEPGSSVRPGDTSSILLAHDVASPPGQNTPFAILGQTVKVSYSYVDPQTGKDKVETKSFVVRGIQKPTGNQIIDKAIVINLAAGNSLLHKSNKYDALLVSAASPAYVDTVEKEIRTLYGQDIGVTTPKAILQTIQQFTGGFTSFILAIALVSLLVGSVGIITTLYTSVNERIREIGTMKAIGAQNSSILGLFLTEALIIGLVGALAGLGLGMLGGFVIVGFLGGGGGLGFSPVFLPKDLATVFALSVSLSLIAGLYPAWRASRLPPIVALRRE
jgi:putative ABC transport system permease protein